MTTSTELPAAGPDPAAHQPTSPVAPDKPGQRRVAVVPHTHWDREWYEPFQTFRLRLVDLVDELLPLLDGDPSFSRYTLDGQMAVIDDYLEIRPAAEGRIRRLASSGRISLGPWYVLMDEFLVSGETIVRNLQRGLARAAAFGGAMPIGYLPDMFGHVSQMPQILRLAGCAHAVVWRGVPAAVDRTAFMWRAPDGSEVRAEYLVTGYGNGSALPDDAQAFVRRLEAYEAEIGSFLLDRIILMNGSDHEMPQAWLGALVDEVNRIQDHFAVEITTLAEELPKCPSDGLAVVDGELRSGARANLLMGVASNRVDIRQAAARAERALERRAEPLCALFRPPDEWPDTSLDLAWRQMILNSAHDSVCACSADEVVVAVAHRYHEARQIAEGLAERALGALGASMRDPGAVIVNTSARTRSGLVETVFPGDALPPGTQNVGQSLSLPGEIVLDVPAVKVVLGAVQGPKIGEDAFIDGARIEVHAATSPNERDEISITLHIAARPRPDFDAESVKREIYAIFGQRPGASVRVRLDQPPAMRIIGRAKDVPGFGWAHWIPAELTNPVLVSDDGGDSSHWVITNGLVTIAIDPSDGTFAVDGIPGFGRLVDGGDLGDTYNYSPPARDSFVDAPANVAVTVEEHGPVRATARVATTYLWPVCADAVAGTRGDPVEVLVTTTLVLHADERFVRVSVAFDNRCEDHRLRALLPLPEPATSSVAECAFALVRRGLTAEGGAHERGLPTYPSRRFVTAGRLTVSHEGLLEYELVDQAAARRGDASPVESADALALTLLRSTGMLSRVGMSYRPMSAGPTDPLTGPQMQGPVEIHYAVGIDIADPFAMADDALLPLEAVDSLGGGTREPTGSELTVTGAEVTAVRRADGDGDDLEVRVFNSSGQPSEVEVPGRSGWVVDLLGRPVTPFSQRLTLGAWKIATLRVAGQAGR
ncbi:MAG: alpha-mannosidase [Actinomycetota bacterium]|nr:alpha-mannosidase [Actinomycetota bacterium]